MTLGPGTIMGNYIAGEWVGAASGATFERRNPADTAELLGTFPASAAADAAAAAGYLAARHGEWAGTPPEGRADVLNRAAAILESRQEELARELVREEGKTLAEAAMETRRTPANLRMYAAEALRLTGQTFPSGDGSLVLTLRQPVGVVAAVTPWNFPLNIPSRKLGPALAAGNAVVFKPSEVTPLLGQRLVEALLEAGVPSSALALVHGGAAAGQALVTQPGVAAVTFTGSTAAGHAIYAAAGPARRCQLEMGGKNAVVVLDDSDLDRAVAVIAKGAFGLAGQACTGTSRVIAHEAVHDELVARLAKYALGIRVGDGLAPGVQMGPLATEAQLAKYLGYVEAAQQEGARLVAGGERLHGPGYDGGFFARPAVFDSVTPQMRIAREEVFGPLLAFLCVSSEEEAVEVANASEYGLSAGIVTGDVAKALRFARRVQAGIIKVNQPTTGMAMNAPFGGLKNSSTQTFKEQAGDAAMQFYTVDKTVYVSP
jgi:acyl-CoA reductase-like NAD-dependent aldehyde dehydrogenase